MQVMIEVTNPLAREQTMTQNEDRSKIVVYGAVGSCKRRNLNYKDAWVLNIDLIVCNAGFQKPLTV